MPKVHKDKNHIPRPANAFILFRSDPASRAEVLVQARGDGGETRQERQADISKQLSEVWKKLPADVKAYWRQRAEEAKEEHKRQYPDYQYRPRPRKGSKKASKAKKEEPNTPHLTSDSTSSISTEDETTPAEDYPLPSTRAIVPIDSGVGPSIQYNSPLSDRWPLGSSGFSYEAPPEFGPPPSIASTLKGKQPWNAHITGHLPVNTTSPNCVYTSFEPDFFSPPPCIDPTLLHSPDTVHPSGLTYVAPQPITIRDDAPFITGAPSTMHPPFINQAGPSSSPHTSPSFSPPFHAPSLTHEESVLLQSLCLRTADYLAATRVPPGAQSPPVGGAHLTSFALNPALLPALFATMARLSHSVSL